MRQFCIDIWCIKKTVAMSAVVVKEPAGENNKICTVHLAKLVSVCMHAVVQSCATIRKVQRIRAAACSGSPDVGGTRLDGTVLLFMAHGCFAIVFVHGVAGFLEADVCCAMCCDYFLDSSVIGARMKNQSDPRTYVTDADELAQVAMVQCIRCEEHCTRKPSNFSLRSTV